jgi:hypothetical protein
MCLLTKYQAAKEISEQNATTLKRCPRAAALVELHLQRIQSQTISFLRQLEQSRCSIRYVYSNR